MRLVARMVLACLVSVSTSTAVHAGGDTAPSLEAVTEPAPVLWLRGPFGTVPSESLDGPADQGGSAADARPLDAWVRSAPLRLETGDPDVSIGEWRASFIRLDGASDPLESDGTGEAGTPATGVTLTGPDLPGSYRLEAAAELSTGLLAEASWAIIVPDREYPADGVIDVPAPRLLLAAASGTVEGWAGNGCHIYLCVEVGRLPPLRMVPHLDVTEGEDLTLRLSDHSPIAAWKVAFYPIVSGIQPAVDEIGDEPELPIPSVTVSAPVESEWLMQAEVVYDRLRGWTHTFYRLTSRS